MYWNADAAALSVLLATIKSNMRCIETFFYWLYLYKVLLIKSNMRCIETPDRVSDKAAEPDKE